MARKHPLGSFPFPASLATSEENTKEPSLEEGGTLRYNLKKVLVCGNNILVCRHLDLLRSHHLPPVPGHGGSLQNEGRRVQGGSGGVPPQQEARLQKA